VTDGWLASLFGFEVAVAGGERAGSESGTVGRSEVHLRPQSLPQTPAEIVSAVAASATTDGAALINPSGTMRRAVAVLVLLGAIGLAAMVIYQWRVGSGATQGEFWEQFRQRWISTRRSRI
jgi:hypothetical protein